MASFSSGHRFGPEALNILPSAEENVNQLAGGGESEQLASAPFVLSGNDDHGVILVMGVERVIIFVVRHGIEAVRGVFSSGGRGVFSSGGHRFGPEALSVLPSAEENVNQLAGGGESEQLAGAPFVLSSNDDHGEAIIAVSDNSKSFNDKTYF